MNILDGVVDWSVPFNQSCFQKSKVAKEQWLAVRMNSMKRKKEKQQQV